MDFILEWKGLGVISDYNHPVENLDDDGWAAKLVEELTKKQSQ